MRSLVLVVAAIVFPVSGVASAGNCEITVGRVSCPGKEVECYKKCDGKETCLEIKKKTASVDACSKEAFKNCTVFRPGVTKAKKIVASFDGKPIEGGKDFCQPEKPEFNWGQCK